MADRIDEFMPPDEGARGDEELNLDEDETVEIRAEILETRGRMGDTLEQLGERLNPGRLKDQVKQDVRDATIGKVEHMAQSAAGRADEARHTITETIRGNPIPATMVGVGLGWLFYNATQQRSRSTTRSADRSGWSRTGGYASGGYASTGYGLGYAGSAGQVGDRSDETGMIDRVRDRASGLADNVQDTAGELADRAQQAAGRVAGRAQDVTEHLTEETRYQARRVEDQFYENPLAVGAAALAIGMVAGLAIPETRKESEVMGSARNRLMHKVGEMAEETKDKVEHVAERVVDQAQSAAKQAAKDEGLTSA